MPAPPLRRTTVVMLSVPIYQSLFVPPDSAMSSGRKSPPLIDSSWWSDARCNDGSGTLGPVFFSLELRDIVEAKRICAGCPVIAPCLEGALQRREPWGVWGGQLFHGGRIVRHKRPPGRPRKHPSAEHFNLEVPVPEQLRELAG